jgi:hypothetical protein
MKIKLTNQVNFSSIFFDTLFGLVLFFSLDSFLEIKDPIQFIFYLVSTIILVHWWLIFKSADDAFESEVTDSAADIVFGIVYIILIDYIILLSDTPKFIQASYFLLALLAVDTIWALVWKNVGHWRTKNRAKIVQMEQELSVTIKVNLLAIVLFTLLVVIGGMIPLAAYLVGFIVIYALYIVLTFQYHIIDIDIF